ncbi:MAG: ATP-binding protein [Nitrospinaceae bacterium]|nr:ATP-binding protein [Nitrospinaceae bacterium]NIR57394.1 ATP-binding protein [Nitrospinaceae bacterium]NIS87846.1 ATP-binding protein [Nitrospinaceae bacterium]NIT84717.1 ATP-binding protein [Nitrospinaceae bacterium]NIU46895.1 ATP-binding protein [Nitrospinaceae bacterium]
MILDFPSYPEFSFSNFVVSQGSLFAFDTVREFCSGAPLPYQSLFLYGPANLGKTHLLIALGNHIARHPDNVRALYIHGSDFVRKMNSPGRSEGNKTLTQFLDVDYFLLDDVEALADRLAAQERLYAIYNELTAKGKKLAFTGHGPPNRLKGLEPYLKSRLQWGMTAEIRPIDDATTKKIIAKLAQDVGLWIPDKIIDYLLTRIPRDFLSIKNTVTKLNHESYIQKKKVSLPLAKAALDLP